MSIDAELIQRQAAELQRLQLEPARATELAEEVRVLVDNAMSASMEASFDDDPDSFLYLLAALRDAPLS